MLWQQSKPFVVTVIPDRPTDQTTLLDVILGSIGITLVAVLIALVLGAVVGYILVRWHRRHPAEDDHLPSISPLVSDSHHRPSDQAR